MRMTDHGFLHALHVSVSFVLHDLNGSFLESFWWMIVRWGTNLLLLWRVSSSDNNARSYASH